MRNGVIFPFEPARHGLQPLHRSLDSGATQARVARGTALGGRDSHERES